MTPFETVIGLEVHLQLKTQTKIFCACRNAFGDDPNTNVCPVCLGLPGTLPVLNRQVLYSGIKVGLALNCSINTFVKFDRKNYYYPDLPKGYQISQYDFPIAKEGYLNILVDGREKKIGITRAHLEEDAGKLVHDNINACSLVDYNRTGTPLVEIVSEPDLRSSQEAYDYLTILKLTLQYLDVSDCDMEKGSLRCDANVSIRPAGETKLGTKTELKNLNSFSAVKRAIDFEVQRQTAILLAGGNIVQETLLWNEAKGQTVSMRSKEQAHDYRYFPEPDLVPFIVHASVIDQIRQGIPELPQMKLSRFAQQYGLSAYDAGILVQSPLIATFFEECSAIYPETKKISNWLNGPLLQELNARRISLTSSRLTAINLISLIKRVEDGTISHIAAKDIFPELLVSGREVDALIAEKGLAQVSDDAALEKIIDGLLASNPKTVQEIKSGKTSAAGFLIGQAMKATQGRANPKKLNDILTRRLNDA